MSTSGIRTTTQTYIAEDGKKFTLADVDGNGTVDKARIDQVNAQGQTTQAGEWQYLDDASAHQLFQDLATNYGLTVEGEGTNEVLAKLDPGQRGTLTSIASALTDGTTTNASIQGRWADFVSGLQVNGNQDINALVQQVLRESYLETNKDLAFYAEKVQFYNQLKKDIRGDISDLRKILAKNAGSEDGDALNPANISAYTNDDGTPIVDTSPDGQLYPYSGTPGESEGHLVAVRENEQGLSETPTKGELSAYIDKLEQTLNSVGDDSQLANVDLQNVLQKQQQTLQMMSNISKMLYDTAMAIVRKVGG